MASQAAPVYVEEISPVKSEAASPTKSVVNEIKIENDKKTNDAVNQKEISQKEIDGFVEKANNLVLIFDKSIKFVVDVKSGTRFIDVIDNKTNEVIKKIPPENIRKFMDAISTMVGLIVDKKA